MGDPKDRSLHCVVNSPRPTSHQRSRRPPVTTASTRPPQRREVAKELREVADTFAEVPDGKMTSHVLGVLAHLLDPT